MSDKILSDEMIEAFRADLGRCGLQRARVEQVRRMCQAIESRNSTKRQSGSEADDAD